MSNKQLNLQMTKEFEKAVDALVRHGEYPSKSEAVRQAVLDAARRLKRSGQASYFRDLLVESSAFELNPKPRFRSDDDLWS